MSAKKRERKKREIIKKELKKVKKREEVERGYIVDCVAANLISDSQVCGVCDSNVCIFLRAYTLEFLSNISLP